MNIYKGIPASNGIGIGPAHIIHSETLSVPCSQIDPRDKENGWLRFEKARNSAIGALQTAIENEEKEQKDIFQTHCLMLSDPEFLSQVKKEYESASYTIEYILYTQVEKFATQLESIGDAYLTERANDIRDAYGKVLSQLCGKSENNFEIKPKSIIIADNLKPSDALTLAKKDISGIVTHEGGKGSHLAILARAYGIPFVSGIEHPETCFTQNVTVIVDGTEGCCIHSPDSDTLKKYNLTADFEVEAKKRRASFADKPCKTKDGTLIHLFANISTEEEAELAQQEGADGIGLFRTEFLLMNSPDFSEETQYKAYRRVLECMQQKPVTIRTLDIGGDKAVNKPEYTIEPEKNPLLGHRAIRFCLSHADLFKTQLRALYRASTYGRLRIMIPMITSVSEVQAVHHLIQDVQNELSDRRIPFNRKTPVGIMIETPAAALTASLFEETADFFSIGTNDLTQYTLCVDRENTCVADIFNEFHPAVLSLISSVKKAAENSNKDLCVCGELAGTAAGALTLIGLGITNLSVSTSRILELKELFSAYSIAELSNMAADLLTQTDAETAAKKIQTFLSERN